MSAFWCLKIYESKLVRNVDHKWNSWFGPGSLNLLLLTSFWLTWRRKKNWTIIFMCRTKQPVNELCEVNEIDSSYFSVFQFYLGNNSHSVFLVAGDHSWKLLIFLSWPIGAIFTSTHSFSIYKPIVSILINHSKNRLVFRSIFIVASPQSFEWVNLLRGG